jgi:hypothetical protein
MPRRLPHRATKVVRLHTGVTDPARGRLSRNTPIPAVLLGFRANTSNVVLGGGKALELPEVE